MLKSRAVRLQPQAAAGRAAAGPVSAGRSGWGVSICVQMGRVMRPVRPAASPGRRSATLAGDRLGARSRVSCCRGQRRPGYLPFWWGRYSLQRAPLSTNGERERDYHRTFEGGKVPSRWSCRHRHTESCKENNKNNSNTSSIKILRSPVIARTFLAMQQCRSTLSHLQSFTAGPMALPGPLVRMCVLVDSCAAVADQAPAHSKANQPRHSYKLVKFGQMRRGRRNRP